MRALQPARSSADSTPPAARVSAAIECGDFALIKIVGAGLGEPRQGIGQTPERQVHGVAVRRADRRQAVGQPHAPAFVIEPQIRRGARDLQRRKPVDRQAVARQRGRRRHQLAPRQAAETLDREGIAAHRARDGERKRAVHVAVVLDLRPGEQLGPRPAGQRIGCRIEPRRRDRAEIDDFRPVGAGADARP